MKYKRYFHACILAVALIILGSFATKVLQVAILHSMGVAYDIDTKTIISPQALQSAPQTHPHVIDYRSIDGFGIMAEGFYERIDDLSLWHLVIVLLTLYLCLRAYRGLPSYARSKLDAEPFLAARDWFIVGAMVFFACALYFFHLRHNAGEIHGTFFVQTKIFSIRILQIVEGFLHLATAIPAYVVIPFMARLVKTVFSGLDRGDGYLESANYLLNVALFPLSAATGGFVFVVFVMARSILVQNQQVMSASVASGEALLLTLLWSLPFMYISFLAFDSKPPEYEIEAKITKVFGMLNLSKRKP